MGNHFVLTSSGESAAGQSNPHALLRPDVARLAHVPVRSRNQFLAKIAIGWLANLRRVATATRPRTIAAKSTQTWSQGAK